MRVLRAERLEWGWIWTILIGTKYESRKGFLKDQVWWHTPLIPAFGRQRQVNLYVFEASLVFIMSFKTARAMWRDPT